MGFDKKTAVPDVAVVGDALDDPNFTGGSDLVRYSVPLGNAQGPFQVEVELWYQPIGFRWAHNLEPYDAMEPKRFVSWYNAMSSDRRRPDGAGEGGSDAIVARRSSVTQGPSQQYSLSRRHSRLSGQSDTFTVPTFWLWLRLDRTR